MYVYRIAQFGLILYCISYTLCSCYYLWFVDVNVQMERSKTWPRSHDDDPPWSGLLECILQSFHSITYCRKLQLWIYTDLAELFVKTNTLWPWFKINSLLFIIMIISINSNIESLIDSEASLPEGVLLYPPYIFWLAPKVSTMKVMCNWEMIA